MVQQEQQEETIRKLKKQLKVHIKKLEDLEGEHKAFTVRTLPSPDDISNDCVISHVVSLFLFSECAAKV